VRKIHAYEPTVAAGLPAWKRLDNPPWLSERRGTLVLEPPPDVRVTVNGLDVVGGLQVVEPGDSVNGPAVSYVVGRPTAEVEPGGGRTCSATGRPIAGEPALRCPVCGTLYAQSSAEQIGRCLSCGTGLYATEELPPEELL
jgi:hypothetical protein